MSIGEGCFGRFLFRLGDTRGGGGDMRREGEAGGEMRKQLKNVLSNSMYVLVSVSCYWTCTQHLLEV